jgi:hypothetical protein
MGPELLSRIASKGFQPEVDGTEAVLERALRKLRDENIERLNDTVMGIEGSLLLIENMTTYDRKPCV